MTIRERQSRAFELLQEFERQARRINCMPFGIERDQAESLFVLKFLERTRAALFERKAQPVKEESREEAPSV